MSQVSDTHGKVLERLQRIEPKPGDGIIILGDAGLNFYLNKTDEYRKTAVQHFLTDHDCWLYCVRGNHEARPQTLGYNWITDNQVEGKVYIQTKYPRIRYFMDGETYMLQGYKTLVIGGAYSVDKYYRLAAFGGKDIKSKTNGWTGWFEDEQLTKTEMNQITTVVKDEKYSLVLSHTCPIDWQPRDLFISQVNQSTIDNTMEFWLQELKDRFKWDTWIFGHYHDDRLVRPYVEMYYEKVEKLSEIFDRWEYYKKTGTVDYALKRDPMFMAV